MNLQTNILYHKVTFLSSPLEGSIHLGREHLFDASPMSQSSINPPQQPSAVLTTE